MKQQRSERQKNDKVPQNRLHIRHNHHVSSLLQSVSTISIQ